MKDHYVAQCVHSVKREGEYQDYANAFQVRSLRGYVIGSGIY